MKARLVDGCYVSGEPRHAGDVVDLASADFLDLLSSGRAVAVDAGDHARAVDASNRAALRLEKQSGVGAWLRAPRG